MVMMQLPSKTPVVGRNVWNINEIVQTRKSFVVAVAIAPCEYAFKVWWEVFYKIKCPRRPKFLNWQESVHGILRNEFLNVSILMSLWKLVFPPMSNFQIYYWQPNIVPSGKSKIFRWRHEKKYVYHTFFYFPLAYRVNHCHFGIWMTDDNFFAIVRNITFRFYTTACYLFLCWWQSSTVLCRAFTRPSK